MKIKFKRNSWHRRLHTYALGLRHLDLPNLCPYFWITVFCLLILPGVFVFKSFRGVVIRIFDGIEWGVENILFAPLDRWLFGPMYEYQLAQMDGVAIYRLYRKGGALWEKWFELNRGKTDQLLAQYRLDYKKWQDEQKKEKERRKQALEDRRENRRRFAFKIAGIMQKTFPVVACAILGGLGYGAWWLYGWLHGLDVNWLQALKVIALSISGILLGLIVIAGVVVLTEKFKERRPRLSEEPGLIRRGFGCVSGSIRSFFDFFAQYIKASKDNYCPAIEWED